MKKLFFVIVLIITIFSFDKVYASDVDNIRDYRVNIVFDKENGELRIHESFSTGNYNEDKLKNLNILLVK